jgi:hypothetical protein
MAVNNTGQSKMPTLHTAIHSGACLYMTATFSSGFIAGAGEPSRTRESQAFHIDTFHELSAAGTNDPDDSKLKIHVVSQSVTDLTMVSVGGKQPFEK